MRNITIRLTSNGTGRPIELGFTGENEVTQITFDYTDWLQEFGDGGLTVSVQRDGDAYPYTVILTRVDATKYVWVLDKETDLAKAGLGIFEATYRVDSIVKKSATYRFNVIKSMGEDTEQPEPYVAWIADAQEISAEVAQNAYNAAQSALQAQEALEEFTSITVSVNTLPAGSQATASYSDGRLTLGIPQGVKGDKGDTGDTGETGNGIASVVLNSDYTLTINFTNGDSTTTTSIRGEQGERGIQGETGATGNGIASAVLNADYTLTLTFTNGDTYTTPSIRGEKGDAGVVQDVTVNGQSVLTGNVANITIPEITKTVTGNPITIDDADGEVKSLNVELAPIQEGTPRQDSTVYNEPYLSKDSPSFNSEYDKLVGGTVAWNQLARYYVLNGGTLTTENGIVTITPTNRDNRYRTVSDAAVYTIPVYQGHKYLQTVIIKSDGKHEVGFQNYLKLDATEKTTSAEFVNLAGVYNASDTGGATVQLYSSSITPYQIKENSFMLFDLTQMFGTTVADAIYALEQNEAGSGIAFLKSYDFFAKDYYPYNEGELISAKPTAHVTSQTYPLAGVELRGIPKISNGALYYDGDTQESSGKTTRKYGSVDLGTLTWSKNSGENVYYATLNNGKNADDINAVTDAPYTYIPRAQTSSDKIFKIVSTSTVPMMYFRNDSTSTIADFINTINGKNIVYELATPTTETVTGFTSPQAVGSTESYTDNRDVPIPVGHESRYADIFPIYPNTAVDVEDTNGTDTQTVTVPLNDLYGGTVDVIGGQGSETGWAARTLTGSDNWDIQNGVFVLYLGDSSNIYRSTTTTTESVIISDIFKSNGLKYRADCGDGNIIKVVGDNTQIACYSSAFASVNDFKAYLNEHPMQIAYKLATPTPLTTTPTPLTLYKGDNVVSSDGAMELTYVRNLQAVIDKLENA